MTRFDLKKRYCFDPKCLELAEHFLPADAPEVADLAQWIQDHVEMFLTGSNQQIAATKVSAKGIYQPACDPNRAARSEGEGR